MIKKKIQFISDKRILILNKVRNFVSINKKIASPLEYQCTWVPNTGYFKVNSFYNNNFYLDRFKAHLNEFFLISSLSDYRLLNLKKKYLKNKKRLIISWFTKNDFSKNLIYKDKYIPIRPNNNTIYFLLNVGKFFDPKKLKNKNLILYQKEKEKNFNFFFLIKSVLNFFLSKKYKVSSLSVYSVFAHQVADKIMETLDNNDFKEIILPYEAQPFQKLLISKVRQKYKKIKFISYLSAMQPFPIHLHDHSIIPDMNYAVSPAQIMQLTKIFSWNKKKVKLIKAHRFDINLVHKYKNKIVLPYFINEKRKIYDNLFKLINSKPKNFFSQISLAPHPAGLYDKSYMKFVKSLESMIVKFDYKFDKKIIKNQSIIIGSTSTIFEALEYGLEVFHIVNEPLLESLDYLFWPTIKISNFNDNIFIYRTKYKKKLINY